MPDRTQQHLVVERFRQKLYSPCLHRLDRHRHVAVTGDEDDRHVDPLGGDQLLELEPIQVWKTDIEHETTGRQNSGPVEELLRGRECLWLPTGGVDQELERFAHGDIVIHDEHDWGSVRHGEPSGSAKRGPERVEQSGPAEWLEQTRHRAPLDETGTNALIRVRSD